YYPTRTEIDIMRVHLNEMADLIGEDALIIEYGSGSCIKTRLLLSALRRPVGYVPIEISREHLMRSAEELAHMFAQIQVLPVCADYLGEYGIPIPHIKEKRRVFYFPGSTIGN